MKIAQLGVGYWGPNLLRNLVASKRCEVSAVVDLSPERRGYVNSLYPAVHVTESIEKVLEDTAITAVVIATPAATHYDLAMRALEAGKHVFVEKPWRQAWRRWKKSVEWPGSGILLLMVGHTFLFNAAVRYVKS